jgi:hypothetical protein
MTELAVLAPDLETWERQPKEPDKAWEAFVLYRDMGGRRSYEKVRQQLGKPSGYVRQIEVWGVKWRWVERVYHHDLATDRAELERMTEQRAGMKLKHVRIADRIEDAVEARLTGGEITLEDGTVVNVDALDPNRWGVGSIVMLLELAHKMKLLAHGEATDHVRGVFMLSTADVSRLIEGVIQVAYDFWGTDPRWGMFIEQVRSLPGR